MPGQENRQEKRSGRENAKRRGNAKKKGAHLGLIDGASDSVGNHVGMSRLLMAGEPGFFLVVLSAKYVSKISLCCLESTGFPALASQSELID